MAHILEGVVISAKVPHTVVVEVRTRLRHKVYKKVINKTKRLKAHHDLEGVAEGDRVQLRPSRPLSKTKHHVVVAKIQDTH